MGNLTALSQQTYSHLIDPHQKAKEKDQVNSVRGRVAEGEANLREPWLLYRTAISSTEKKS